MSSLKLILTTQMEEEIINKYRNNNSTIFISNNYEIPIKTVRDILIKNKIPIKNKHECNRKIICIEDIFCLINTSGKAYWIGQFLTDGYVTSRNQVGITLSAVDIEQLHKFKKFMHTNALVHIYKPSKNSSNVNNYCKIIICNSKLANSLRMLGIVPFHKDTSPLINLDSKLKIDLIRGMLDGDGSLSCTTRVCKFKNNYKEYKVSFTGTLNLVNFFSKFILDNKIAKKRTIFKYKNRENSYYLNLQGNILKRFLDLLYENSDKDCYLERKHIKYLELCDFMNELRTRN